MNLTRGLLFRLMAAFALVIFVVVAIIFVIANLTTTNEFRSYMFRGGMSQTDQIANELAAYYAARGSWQGVDAFVAPALPPGMGQMMGSRGSGGFAMMSVPIYIADSEGVVVAPRDAPLFGHRASSAQLANGTPIQWNGQIVGTLIEQSPTANAFDAAQQDFLARVNLSILVAGIAAGLIALGIGFLLFRQITAPLNALAAASHEIAAGDLSARVAKTGDDEVGQVGSAFNAMAESLAKSETARRNMIADIAHELRNPLGVIQGQLEGMIDGVFPTTPEQIASVYDETLLVTRLVDDLRDLALADAGQLQIARQPTDLGTLIEKTVAAFVTQAAEKNIALKTEAAVSLPTVNIDAQRIEQVLRNLIGNALRHTQESGVISVQWSVNSEQSSVVVRVSDTGAGIPREDLPFVFDRFWRSDKSRSRAGGGAGLGLAIAKQLVTAHGGAIGVESEPERGATFWFTLPLK
ncbi:MAG: HAMP domain-containing protein [Chloroflexota bacterium]|nr:HAMP domain-containing protein [Chloroflexota bacterium]